MSEKTLSITVGEDCGDWRLDTLLAFRIPEVSRSFLQKLIRDGGVKKDGAAVTLPRRPVRPGEVFELTLPETESTVPAAEEFTFPVIYEDAALLIIDKPPGVVVHPAAGNPTGTVVNALLGRYPDWLEELDDTTLQRPGIVHRLDKDTSGCLAVAKDASSQFKLAQAFAGREVSKKYLAVVRGVPRERKMEIATLIGRHPVHRQKMAVVAKNGKEALSRYRVVASGVVNNVALSVLEVDIFTGRTHQIRVHLASIGHPVLGDELYGGVVAAVPAGRQMLHAWKLWLPHPQTGEKMAFVAPIPADMQGLINAIGEAEK